MASYQENLEPAKKGTKIFCMKYGMPPSTWWEQGAGGVCFLVFLFIFVSYSSYRASFFKRVSLIVKKTDCFTFARLCYTFFVSRWKSGTFFQLPFFFSITTVFIATRRDFIVMKTVVAIHELGNSRQRRRSLWKSSAHLMGEKRKKCFWRNGDGMDFLWKYSILRELRFSTL